MLWFGVRVAVSAVLIAAIAAIGRRSPTAAALVASLPLVSVLGMIWLWRDTRDPARLATHAEATFWYVLPTLPMFLLIPRLLRAGVGFWPALGVGCGVTVALYLVTRAVAARFGMVL